MTNGGSPPSVGYCEYKRDILSIMWQKHMYFETSNRDTPTFWPLVIIFWPWLNIRWRRIWTRARLGFHSSHGSFEHILFLFIANHIINCVCLFLWKSVNYLLFFLLERKLFSNRIILAEKNILWKLVFFVIIHR